MRTLVEKEIRLLLPAFAAALVLAILPVWLLPVDSLNPGAVPGALFWFGVVLLGLSSFGREIGLRTLPFILAQPLERARIWWTKIAILGVLLALAVDAWWLSGSLRSILRPALRSMPNQLVFSGAIVTIYAAVGLWMTLLLRQVVAAFCLTILTPIVIVMPIQALGGADGMVFTALGLYAVAAFFLARRKFLCLQDTAWTGGVISLGGGRAVAEQTGSRETTPRRALLLKELKLHEFTLAGIAALFVVHLGIVALRKLGADSFGRTTLSTLETFGVVWLFVPLMAGSQSVAEERQLGTLDGLLCLPVSRRVQFTMKLLFVLVLGGLLSAALLCIAERIGSAIGAGANLSVMGFTFIGNNVLRVAYLFLVLSLIGFYGSTLTRSVVQALAAGVVATLVFLGVLLAASESFYAFGARLWPVMAFPTLAVAVIWLAYGNFRWLFESGRRWRRNILGLIIVNLLICASAAGVYHRAWEWVMPLEGAHGTARLPEGKPVMLRGNGATLAAVLPDGRFWECSEYSFGATRSGGYFVPGSNWVDAVPLERETVGIQSDGTLWVSEKPQWLDRLVQVGVETDWQLVARATEASVVLLKRDGTLWRWGTNSVNYKTYQGLSSYTPFRVGESSDWARILRGVRTVYAWKKDGTAWALHQPEQYEDWGDARVPDLDRVQFQSLTSRPPEAGIREDGTLWENLRWWGIFWRPLKPPKVRPFTPVPPELVKIGNDSKWVAVEGGAQLLGLKSDGSLWKWTLFRKGQYRGGQYRGGRYIEGPLESPPERLGTHNDWVALGTWFNGSVALAADGTLWSWPATDAPWGWDRDESNDWLARSRRPAKIENILDARQQK